MKRARSPSAVYYRTVLQPGLKSDVKKRSFARETNEFSSTPPPLFNALPTPIPAVKLNVPFVTHLNDRIRHERRAHTMAPLSRISGPSSTPKARMFATPFVPAKLPRSHRELTDDDTPIVVKVRYHADAGGPPSEHVVRQAIDEQFHRQRWNRRRKHEPLIVNFLGPAASKPVELAHRSRSISCKQPFQQPPKPVIHQQRSSLKGFSSLDWERRPKISVRLDLDDYSSVFVV